MGNANKISYPLAGTTYDTLTGSGAVSYQYDEYGRITQVQNSQATQTFTYDDLDNLTEEAVTFTEPAGKSYSIASTYNTDGAR